MSAKGKDYYAGGYRVTIGGIPCRINVKPTPHMLALMREDAHSYGLPAKTTREMAKARFPQTTYLPPESDR